MRIKSTFKTLLSAIWVSIFTIGAAHASTITFDFTGGTSTGDTATYTSNGMGLTVTAFSQGRAATLTSFTNGAIGVGTGADPNFDGLDASGLVATGESLLFEFDTVVTLDRTLVFESGTGFDAVEVTNLDTRSSTIFTLRTADTLLDTDTINTVVVDLIPRLNVEFDPVGSAFLFTTVVATGSNPGVAIKDITISGVIAPVPLPASWPLLATAISAGFALRRRKRPQSPKRI